ncbi:MAG: hypothetical protein M1822_004295 [Bathelium mastoideum]|nr:MAG: hypothetical protein M1822_004295 [Bathelium mastoideum]
MLDQLFQYATLLNLFLLVLLSLLAYASISAFCRSRRLARLGHEPPQRPNCIPWGIDVMWDGIQHLRQHKNLELWHKMFYTWGNKNNPYTVQTKLAGTSLIFTGDPENIKAVLATQFTDFGKGEQFQRDWDEFLGHSIFATDGSAWATSRQLLRPLFAKDRLSNLHCFELHTQALFAALPPTPGEPIDIADLFFRFTLDAATDFLLGHSVHSLAHPAHEFAHAFAAVQHTQSVITRAGPFNALVPRARFRRHLRTLNAFLQPFIERALRLSPAELAHRSQHDEGYTFLHALAAFTRDRTVLRDQLVATLLAGRDTTACTLSWCLLELSRNPAIVAKLRREVLATVGPARAPSFEDLKAMRYLRHVLDETLRLYPVVPFNMRIALRDTTLPHGGGPNGDEPIGVLKGSTIGYSTLVMQRRADMYPAEWSAAGEKGGLDPGRFVPERWEEWTPKPWR